MSGPDVVQLCDRARDQLHKRDLAAAKELFAQAIALDPDCCEAHEGLATCAYMIEDYPTAIAEFIRLTLLQPLEGRHLTNLGAIHNRIGEHMKAADYLRRAITRNKKCAESFYNLGIAQRKLKQNAMAVSAYKEAIKLAPNMAEAYQNLGNVYVDMGNLQMAIMNFNKALEIRPNFDKARAGLEKAEQQLAEAKNRNNQMGRLNAMTSTVTSVAAICTRELRDDERYEDRKCIKQLADEIERLAQGCVNHLKHNVVPAILEVERAMGHGADEAVVLTEAADLFRTATSQWATLRRSLKRKVAELAEHEQFINEPVAKS
jgi:tetratricopeptide (TPR) repeat protein